MKPETFLRSGRALRLRKGIGCLQERLATLWNAVRRCRADAVFLEGKEIRSGEVVRSFYFGNHENYPWIFGRLYSEHEVRETGRNVSVFSAGEWIKRNEGRADLVVVDLEYLHCRKFAGDNPGYLRVPQWVRQRMDVGERGEAFSEVLKTRSVKSDLRRIARHGLTCRIAGSEKDFREFYDDMYLPFARKRFGDAADVESRRKVLRRCRKGILMQIVRGDEVVAAGLLHRDGDRLSDVLFGVSPRIEGEVIEGAYCAAYYYSIRYGCEAGCRVVDFLGSRPVLNDGVFRFKRKWRAELYESPVLRGDVLLRPVSLDGPVANLFTGNCFITIGNEGLVGKILLKGERLSGEFVERAVKDYWTEGLAALEIHSMDGADPDALERASASAHPVRIVDLSGEREPHKRFCGRPAVAR